MDFREARELFLRDVERGVLHPERLEDARACEVRERLARELFDEIALDVDGDAVGPARARLREQRNPAEALDHLRQRRGRIQHVAVDDHLVDRVGRAEDVAEPRGVGHQLAHRHRPARVLQLRRAVVVLSGVDLQFRELRNVARHGIVEPPLAFLVQHHHRNAGDRFAHRVDPEDRILLQRIAAADAALASRVEVDDLAVALDQPCESGDLLVVDDLRHRRVEALETVRGDADRLRRRHRQIAWTFRLGVLRGGRPHQRCSDEQTDESVAQPFRAARCPLHFFLHFASSASRSSLAPPRYTAEIFRVL